MFVYIDHSINLYYFIEFDSLFYPPWGEWGYCARTQFIIDYN